MTSSSGFTLSSDSSVRPFLKLLMPLATSPTTPEILPVPNSSKNTNEAIRMCAELSPIGESPAVPGELGWARRRPRERDMLQLWAVSEISPPNQSRFSGLDADLAGHVRVEHTKVLDVARLCERE